MKEEDTFGFIVVDGHGALFASVCGSNRTVLHKFSVSGDSSLSPPYLNVALRDPSSERLAALFIKREPDAAKP